MTAPFNRPRIEVDAPTRRKVCGGLADAARVHNVDKLPVAGVWYETDACNLQSCIWPDRCDPNTPDPRPGKLMTECCPTLVTADPFTLWAGACEELPDTMGRDVLRRRARANFEAAKWRGIEAYLSNYLPTVAVDVTIGGPGGPFGITAAVAALEQALAANYDGVGIIHGPRYAGAYLAEENQICCDTACPQRTPMGTDLSLGGGYCAMGPSPDCEIATDCEFWLYATGGIDVYQSQVQVIDTVDHVQNTAMAIAEQSFAVAIDCGGVYGARVNVCLCCTPVAGP